MIRLGIIAFASLVLASCQPAGRPTTGIESPIYEAPYLIQLTYSDERGGHVWGARAQLDEDGQLMRLDLECDGRSYASLAGGELVSDPPVDDAAIGRVLGGHIGVYGDTTCEGGTVEFDLYSEDTSRGGRVPLYRWTTFAFHGGEFAGAGSGSVEHL